MREINNFYKEKEMQVNLHQNLGFQAARKSDSPKNMQPWRTAYTDLFRYNQEALETVKKELDNKGKKLDDEVIKGTIDSFRAGLKRLAPGEDIGTQTDRAKILRDLVKDNPEFYAKEAERHQKAMEEQLQKL
jgi:hypothetical protein